MERQGTRPPSCVLAAEITEERDLLVTGLASFESRKHKLKRAVAQALR